MKKLVMTTVVTAAAFAASFAAAATFTYDYTLRYGMNGSEVTELQNCLNSISYHVGYADGMFGNMTYAGVKAFQTDHSLTPDGIVGPMTGAALETACNGSTTTTTTTTGSSDEALCPNGMTIASNCTTAPAGSSSDEALCPNGMTVASNCTAAPGASTSTVTSTEEADLSVSDIDSGDDLDADKDGQKAFSVEIEADEDGGDAAIERMDLSFEITPKTGGEEDLYDIIKKVTLEVNGEEVASKVTTDDDDWRNLDNSDKTGEIRLSGFNTVVKSDEKVTFDVILDIDDLDDTDDLSLDIALTGVEARYVDGAGIVDLVSATSTKKVSVTPVGAFDMTFKEDNSSPDDNAALDLSSSISKEKLVVVEAETADTQDGVLKRGEVTLEITNVNTTDDFNADDLISKLYFYIDGEKIDDTDVDTAVAHGGTAVPVTYTFDLDDYAVNKDTKYEFAVKADFKEVESTDAMLGAQVKVTSIKVEGESDDNEDFGPLTADTSSYAPVFTATAGNLTADVTDLVKYEGSIDNAGTVEFTVTVSNDTGAQISVDPADWTFDVHGVGGIDYSSSNYHVYDAGTTTDASTLDDGETAEYDVIIPYTSVSTEDLSVDVESIDGITVA